jgi:hypothetical protein
MMPAALGSNGQVSFNQAGLFIVQSKPRARVVRPGMFEVDDENAMIRERLA